MRYSELTRRLRRLGVEYYGPAKGSHEVWIWEEKQLRVNVPHHATREIPPGTLRAILRQLGITEDDLRNA